MSVVSIIISPCSFEHLRVSVCIAARLECVYVSVVACGRVHVRV